MRMLLLLAILLTLPPTQEPRAEARPVDVFAGWDGSWQGTFVGYDPTGKELYRIAVRQTYRTLDATTQEVTIRDTMADGEVIEGKGRNTAERAADGTLRLRCQVTKSNGDEVVHEGRVVRGPSDRREIVWSSVSEARSETFREWVDGDRYWIHGMGRYDGTLMLMAGEYRRAE